MNRTSDRLKTEDDPAVRKVLGNLLLDEENQFGATAERLHKAERHIADCKAHIARQYGLIDRLNLGGHDVGPAERLLRYLMELHDLFVRHREDLVAALVRRAL